MKRAFAAVCAVMLCVATAHAHRLDEYLQATTFWVEKSRIQAQITLVPGVLVFPTVFAQIDRDADGIISEAEQLAYARHVLGDLSLTLDGKRLPLRLISVAFPDTQALKEGRGEIQLRFDAEAPRSATQRRLTFANHHHSRIAAYLVNSLVPRDPEIRITAQNRNFEQSFYQLDYTQAGARSGG